MTTTRRLAPLSLALVLTMASGSAFAAPQAKREGMLKSVVKSVAAGIRVGSAEFRERREKAGPGLISRTMTKTGAAIGRGATATKERIGAATEATKERIGAAKDATVKGVRNSLVARMTIGVVDAVKLGGRLIARPFKKMAAAVREERAAVKQARAERALKATEGMGTVEMQQAVDNGKISKFTMRAAYDARVAGPKISPAQAHAEHQAEFRARAAEAQRKQIIDAEFTEVKEAPAQKQLQLTNAKGQLLLPAPKSE
jgi:hypothetical protein